MANLIESRIEQWTADGLIDPAVRDRLLAWERAHAEPQRWPVRVALAFGAILLAAGVLLFVSAHWDRLSPASRMTLVVAMVAVFHAGGAASAGRFEGLSVALHTLGTVALGAAIALAGQIFNLSDHWPSAILLWSLGALAAWALLGHWTQAALAAILLPYWLAGEWWTVAHPHNLSMLPVAVGVCSLSLVYLSARRGADDSLLRKALAWIGGIALLPSALALGAIPYSAAGDNWSPQAIAWAVAILAPLAIAIVLQGRDAVWSGAAIVWTQLLAVANGHHLAVYVWCAAGSAGLAFWGTRESRPERINLGILGFALTVAVFYFSDVMDKLGRSAGLMAVGLLLLGGGWLLERARRRLLTHARQEAL